MRRLIVVFGLVLLVSLSTRSIAVQADATILNFQIYCNGVSVSGTSTSPYVGVNILINGSWYLASGQPGLSPLNSYYYPVVSGGHYQYAYSFPTQPNGTSIEVGSFGANTNYPPGYDGGA